VTETTLSSTQIEREEDELDCIDADPLEIRPEADERDLDVCAKEPNVTTLKSNIHSKGTASISSAPGKVEVVKKRSSEIDLSHDNPKLLKMAVEKSRAELDLVGLVIFIGEKRVMGPVVVKAKASPSNLVNTTQQLIVVDANRRQFQVINRGREAYQLQSTSSGAKRSISFSSSPSSTSINSSTSPASDIDSLLFSDVRVNCVYKFIGLLNGIYRESTAVNSISYRVSSFRFTATRCIISFRSTAICMCIWS
jgi:hypothetical protein